MCHAAPVSFVCLIQVPQCCESGICIPDPKFSIPDRKRSRMIRIKEFKYYLSLKNLLLCARKYDPGCSSGFFLSRIRIPDPGVKKEPFPGSATLVLLPAGSGSTDPLFLSWQMASRRAKLRMVPVSLTSRTVPVFLIQKIIERSPAFFSVQWRVVRTVMTS